MPRTTRAARRLDQHGFKAGRVQRHGGEDRVEKRVRVRGGGLSRWWAGTVVVAVAVALAVAVAVAVDGSRARERKVEPACRGGGAVVGVGVGAMPVDAGRWRSGRQAEMVRNECNDGSSIYSVCASENGSK